MKRILVLPLLLLAVITKSQLLSWTPDFIKESSTSVIITMDANYGNQGLLNYSSTSDVYVHIGVITNKSTSSSDWKHVLYTWGTTNAAAHCTYLGNNKWSFTITGGLRTFFGVTDGTETIQKIAILFRNGNGSKKQANRDGSDMYVPVYDNGEYARIDVPFKQPTYAPIPEPITKNLGDALSITAKASIVGTLKIYFNGSLLTTSSAASATANTTIAVSGDQQIIAEASNGTTTSRDTMKFVVASTHFATLPPGVKDGINYDAGDTSVTLVLYAPHKNNVFVLGDFNNWTQSANYLMNETPDSTTYWIRITGLTKATEYAYQYLIDGSLKIADYYTEKILDPDNDKYISTTTYPNLKAYPTGKTTGIVSILQTAKSQYTWQVTNFKRPDKRNLLIYELLVRDFVAAQNWQTLKDTLSYLKRLGVNAIEVMPFNEFEGNNSWGYNPSFYFAPDKAYGTETALKQFIDACHQQGFAVIMDMVLNHTYNQSPMAEMYWDAVNNRPAANNPWYNTVAPHAFGFGNDFNHESTATKYFFSRVLQHWISNYKIDGYRLDFSKGLTQKVSTTDAEFSAYDASRIAIINNYADSVWKVDAGAYMILEHFCVNDEEKELSNDGMLVWGNMNGQFNQATMGYSTLSPEGYSWDFSWGIYTSRGWTQPNLITYQESHDEERLMYKNEQYGNSSGTYNVKTLSTGLQRNAMATAFWAMIPGPKMLWQFGELGYDYSINRCQDGTINSSCRTSPKPIRWDFYSDANRQALYNVYSSLFKLRNTANYLSTFTTGTIAQDFSSSIKWLNVSSDSLKVVVYGNFDVVSKTANVTFPSTGTWYSYLKDSVITVTSTTKSVTLPAGAYYVFTNKNLRSIALPVQLLSFTAEKTSNNNVQIKWSTSAEINNAYFEIERSSDASHFSVIGRVNAQTGTTVHQYSFTDALPLSGTNYYRLKQVDKDGQEHYSSVVKINFAANNVSWQLYPNPAHNSSSVYLNENVYKLQLTVTDISGKILYTKTITNAIAGQQIQLPVQQFASGVYFVKLITAIGTSTGKLVIE